MNCCQCQGIETYYNRKSVAKNLKKYRKNGPAKTTCMLIDALKTEDIKGNTLLDISGGVGAIQHELLQAGASRAINVEASKAFIEATKEEAEQQGHADRVSHYHGNFVDLASNIPQTDIVTLDKVICCYPDMQALVRLSSNLARRFYGVIYPQDIWRTKIEYAFENFIYWIQRSSFRVFVHPTLAVDTMLRENGLEQVFYRKAGTWQIVVYTRKEISEIGTKNSQIVEEKVKAI